MRNVTIKFCLLQFILYLNECAIILCKTALHLHQNELTVRNGLINKKVSLKKNYTDMMLKLKIEKGHQHGIVSSNTADLDLDLDAIAGI